MGSSRVVFGFELETPFPLRTARDSTGDPLSVEMADLRDLGTGSELLNWSPQQENPLDATLSTLGGADYVLDIADSGKYLIQSRERHIVMPVMPDEPLREVRLLGLPLLLCFLARGEVSLHGAAVMGPNGAIVLAAPGKHGKTSLAATLAGLGCRLLTEDLSCIRVGAEPVLYPGPASLRIREDMAAHVLPLDGMREIGSLGDRLVLATSDPGSGDPVPLAALVLLKGFEESVSLHPVDPLGALSDLWLLSFHLPTEEDRVRKFNQLVDLVGAIPVWELTQSTDPELIRDTADILIEAVGR
jgi:hypothetical protein